MGPSGSRISPPPSPPSCWRRSQAKQSSIFAQHPAARPPRSPQPALPSLPSNITRRASPGCAKIWGGLRLDPAVVQADATTWQPAEKRDAVLLDAPCSATGTIRRHPDVAHLKRARDLAALTAQQDVMIANAAAMLRPGGRMIYAVCSLQPEEGPHRIAAAKAAGLRHDPFTPDELSILPEGRTPDGCLRTHPGMWPECGGMDGFFAARFIRA